MILQVKWLVSNWSLLRGVSGWPEDLAVGCGWWVAGRGGGAGRELWVFVAVVAVASVVPVSLLVSMVRRVSTRTVDCCLEHERQNSDFLGPPRGERLVVVGVREGVIMEVMHSRCAGMDVSKRDAKVCVRVAGQRVVGERWRR